MTSSQPVQIKPALRKYLAEIVKIERCSFQEPWSKRMFEEELKYPYAEAFVLIYGEIIAAYIFFRRVLNEWTIMNIAVKENFRGMGLGTVFLKNIFDYLMKQNAESVTLEVSEKNIPAQRLYFSLGFQIVGRRPLYYRKESADAFIMELIFSTADKALQA